MRVIGRYKPGEAAYASKLSTQEAETGKSWFEAGRGYLKTGVILNASA